jgi:hypothetical protein
VVEEYNDHTPSLSALIILLNPLDNDVLERILGSTPFVLRHMDRSGYEWRSNVRLGARSVPTTGLEESLLPLLRVVLGTTFVEYDPLNTVS